MQFDLWHVEPPMGEIREPLEYLILAGCTVGLVWILATVLSGRSTRSDWAVWRRSLLGGSVAGVALLVAMLEYDAPQYYTGLMCSWAWGSITAAGLFLLVSRIPERRSVGRWILQGTAAFALGLFVPAIGAALVVRFFMS